jgi:hypothetical protein
MADYEPLIARAIAGLEYNTGENRRVLYERARTALVSQLRGVDPPLEEGDITRERLALEEAIRKIEAEAAANEQAAASAEKPEPEIEPAPEEVPPEKQRFSLGDRGLRSFRETMAEAEGLGRASANAYRAARRSFGTVPGEPAAPEPEETHYFEPAAKPGSAPAFGGEQEEEPAEYVERDMHGGRAGEPEKVPPPPVEQRAESIFSLPLPSFNLLIAALVVLLVVGVGAVAYWQRDTISSMFASRQSTEPAPPPAPASAPAPAATPAPAPAEQAATTPAQPKIGDRIGPATGAPAAAPKTAEQPAQPTQPEQPATAPAATVAQKVVLYEEDPKNPQGKRYVGSAIWRTQTVSPGPGLAPELAVRADVDIPERHMHMTWSLRRNTDKALPASHTIEITFSLPANFDEGGIGNVPGVLMKNSEQARGVPLAGLSVKVTNGYFLIGLSAVDIDKQRNIDLLKTRGWFDIPIVYTSGKRAILAVEKGPPGDRAFQEAFRAWGE